MSKKTITLKANGRRVSQKPKGSLYNEEEYRNKMRELMNTPSGERIYRRCE